MKSRAPLSLMEQLIMLLVFALASAVCLRVFAYADSLSRTNEARDQAVLAVETCAETLKASHGDYAAAADAVSGTLQDGTVLAWYDDAFAPTEAADAAYTLTLTPVPAESPLGSAGISVTGSTGTVYEMTVCWQEVTE